MSDPNVTPDIAYRPTGTYTQVPTGANRMPVFDPRSGGHLWTVVMLFAVNPHNDGGYLDGENLLTVTSPGCFWCEELFTPRLASRRCPGGPM